MKIQSVSVCLLTCMFACSSGGSTSGTDSVSDLSVSDSSDLSGSGSGTDLGESQDLAAAPDLKPAIPSDADCFTDWKQLGNCPAPQITESYFGNNCVGTTGVFVAGRYFQSGNKFWTSNGFMPYGPYAMANNLNRDTWNYLSPRLVCITTSNDASVWSGFAMQLRNPDGQLSNSVTVLNKAGLYPALPSSGTTNPFDLNACMDTPMTMTQAQARFVPPASSAALGTVTISRRSRACNAVSGCGSFGAPTTEATLPATLQVTGGTSIELRLGASSCGTLSASSGVVTNTCPSTGPAGSYSAHLAGNCLMLWQRQFSSVAGDGSYTQTDYGAVIKF